MIWLTGANGMLGSSFVNLLRQKKINFLFTGREVDVTSELDVINFIKKYQPKIIVNCSAYTEVDLAESNFIKCYQLNSFAPKLLGSVAKKYGIKVLHISTDYVFDGQETSPYEETSKTNPINIYGKTKLEGELLLEQSEAKSWIVRTSWLFGKNKKNFVSSMLQQMQNKEEVFAVNDSFGCPTYTDDLAEACLELIQHDVFGKYHICNSDETSWYQFANEIFNQSKKIGFQLATKKITPVDSNYFSRAAARPKYSVLNNSKITKILNKSPRSHKEALQDYLREVL